MGNLGVRTAQKVTRIFILESVSDEEDDDDKKSLGSFG